MQNQKVVGTNCYNCMYVSKKEEPVDSKELNDQGGIDPKTKEDMKKAEKADLITLPGGPKADASNKKFCGHEKIKMFVTVRMCCGYWDNQGVKRPWKK
ncbi:MAG TPA: hypothetical protein VLU95_02860 [Candidatus Acidoferrum sp.]|nr:hypothetical protein [Candidatus Acidoferrum sp.]